MGGKIFKDSSSIYQDQAQILLDYFELAAEKIVKEEEQIEKKISILEEEKKELKREYSKIIFRKWIFGIFVFPVLYFYLKQKELKKIIALLETNIKELHKNFEDIFREYEVKKLGIAYVPVASQFKYKDKSFIVDHSGITRESEFRLQRSKQNELLAEKIAEIERLSKEAPLVESSREAEVIDTEQYSHSMQNLSQHDYFGTLERALKTVSSCMEEVDVISVSLPLVENNSTYHNYIKEHATSDIPDNAPVLEVFDTNKYSRQISKFQEINLLKENLSQHSAQYEDVLKGFMMTMANSVQAISALKVASADKIVFESNKVLFKILKSPYNHYSPVLEQAEIERIRNENFNYGDSVQNYVPFQLKSSSKVRYNIYTDSWVAEDGSTTNMPFGIHQIHEEIVAPIVEQLMEETRIARLKIYNHIKDQKISYLNKWHQDTEDFYGRNRAESADLINLMRTTMGEYIASYNTMISLQKTEETMKQSNGSLDSTVVDAKGNTVEVFAAFEMQSKEFQKVQTEFENYIELLKEDIDLKAGKFEHIDYYEASLRDGNSRDTAIAAKDALNLDSRRKPLIAVNPLFAKTADLPPAPSIESLTTEHISLNLPLIANEAIAEIEEA
jgi:hypothetical protein